jgi:hypothetical protein
MPCLASQSCSPGALWLLLTPCLLPPSPPIPPPQIDQAAWISAVASAGFALLGSLAIWPIMKKFLATYDSAHGAKGATTDANGDHVVVEAGDGKFKDVEEDRRVVWAGAQTPSWQQQRVSALPCQNSVCAAAAPSAQLLTAASHPPHPPAHTQPHRFQKAVDRKLAAIEVDPNDKSMRARMTRFR